MIKKKGVYNVVAPEYITNMELTNISTQLLKNEIHLSNISSFLLKLVLGEMSDIVLKGNWVSSDKIVIDEFQFKYLTTMSAIKSLNL